MADGLYPWFRVAEGDDLEQGDIFEGFPVPLPGDKLVFNPAEPTTEASYACRFVAELRPGEGTRED